MLHDTPQTENSLMSVSSSWNARRVDVVKYHLNKDRKKLEVSMSNSCYGF